MTTSQNLFPCLDFHWPPLDGTNCFVFSSTFLYPAFSYSYWLQIIQKPSNGVTLFRSTRENDIPHKAEYYFQSSFIQIISQNLPRFSQSLSPPTALPSQRTPPSRHLLQQ